MRRLELFSAALASASAVMVLSFNPSQGDVSNLHLAGMFCVAIAVYQLVNFYFGLTLEPKRVKNQIEGRQKDKTTNDLPQSRNEIDEREFLELPTITENTTELIRPIQRDVERKQRQ
jgi:hypothetical protein